MLARKFRRISVIACLPLAWLISVPSFAADDAPALRLAGSYYVDSRAFTTASIAMSSDRLPANIAFWGFTDFHGAHDSHDLDLTRNFSEYRLSHAGIGTVLGINGLGVQAELNALSGSGNDLVRYGLTYKHDITLPWGSNGWLQWRVFPVESDNDGGQASVIFSIPLSQRLQLRGFADYNVAEHAANRWVIEPELNIQLGERLTALVEYRYNGYEDASPTLNGSAIAVGLRYRISR